MGVSQPADAYRIARRRPGVRQDYTPARVIEYLGKAGHTARSLASNPH